MTTKTQVLVVEKRVASVITAGHAGPPGVSEDAMVYARRTDFVSDTLAYRGEAAAGSSTAAAVWRIRRITLGVDGDYTEEWAASAAFSQVWDDRAALTYA